MTDSAKTEYTPQHVSPPGDTLAETLEETGMSQTELARRMGRPTKTINEIVQGKTGCAKASSSPVRVNKYFRLST